MSSNIQPIFDGHNDLLLHLWNNGDRDGRAYFDGRANGHIDQEKAKAGGLAGGFFAIYAPNPAKGTIAADQDNGEIARGPEIPPIDAAYARTASFEMAAILTRMEQQNPDALKICRSVADIETAQAQAAMAAIMHIEGTEAFGPDLDELDILYAAGLRSLGPVWSRPNIFGTGVPFYFPSTPDIGPGLSLVGKNLLKKCNELGVVFDLSHMNEAGFWDVERLTDAPMVATHSNIHQLCQASRNLTDKQLDAIKASNGVVGLNFAIAFLRADGRNVSDTPLTVMVDHLSYMIDKLGENGVALGSDFDGALVAKGIGHAGGLQALVQAMEAAGYGQDLIQKICWQNWQDVLQRIWK